MIFFHKFPLGFFYNLSSEIVEDVPFGIPSVVLSEIPLRTSHRILSEIPSGTHPGNPSGRPPRVSLVIYPGVLFGVIQGIPSHIPLDVPSRRACAR